PGGQTGQQHHHHALQQKARARLRQQLADPADVQAQDGFEDVGDRRARGQGQVEDGQRRQRGERGHAQDAQPLRDPPQGRVGPQPGSSTHKGSRCCSTPPTAWTITQPNSSTTYTARTASRACLHHTLASRLIAATAATGITSPNVNSSSVTGSTPPKPASRANR